MSRRTDLESEAFGLLFVLTQHLGRRADEALVPFGLTSRQWLLLAVLSRSVQAPTLSEAASAYGTSRQNVKQIALQLAARGYLRLEQDPADARATRVVLTDKVADFDAPQAVAAQRALLDDVFTALSEDELAALESAARATVGHLAGSAS
jgi:DNA-binding MarR family transcriptional regulator